MSHARSGLPAMVSSTDCLATPAARRVPANRLGAPFATDPLVGAALIIVGVGGQARPERRGRGT